MQSVNRLRPHGGADRLLEPVGDLDQALVEIVVAGESGRERGGIIRSRAKTGRTERGRQAVPRCKGCRSGRRHSPNRPPGRGRGVRNRQAGSSLRLRAGGPGCSPDRAADRTSRHLPACQPRAPHRWSAIADRAGHGDRQARCCSGARSPPPGPRDGEAGSRPIADPWGPRRRTPRHAGRCRRFANLLPKSSRSPWRVGRPSVRVRWPRERSEEPREEAIENYGGKTG